VPKWFLPAFSLLLGIASFVAFWIGGHVAEGVISLVILGGFGLVVALGGRSETIRAVRGDERDEYWAGIDRDATVFAGMVLIGALIVMCMWEWGHGRDGSPYSQLAAITGVAYVVGLVVLRLKR
jgi:hypothetical protein